MYCVRVEMAKAISGWVPTARYISKPRAERYGTSFITAISVVDVGDWFMDNWAFGSIGMEMGLHL
jgi:hypothetical protein